MYRRFHERFGTAGLVVAVIALIAALAGTAIAAAGLTAVQKKQVIKIAKKYAGQDGAPGAAGSVGPQGPKGDPGAKGIQGPPGADGTFSTEPLPEGETLTGLWTAVAGGENSSATYHESTLAGISFPIQVSPAPTALFPIEAAPFGTPHTFAVKLEDGAVSPYGFSFPPTEEKLIEGEEAYLETCEGSFGNPEAASGFLCIYPGPSEGELVGPSFFSTDTEAAHPFGITIPYRFETKAGGEVGTVARMRGSWAVTG